MPMSMQPSHLDNFASGQDEEDEDPGSQEAMLEELDNAANAGDDFSAKAFFKTPEGVEPGDGAGGADPGAQLTPELLQQLMELLKQKQGGGAGDVSGGMMPPAMPG